MIPSRQPVGVAVLNTIQALAADLDLSAGIMTCTDLGVDVAVRERIDVVKTAYAAGTASVKYVDYGAVTLAANTPYTITVQVPNRLNSQGFREVDTIMTTRAYTWYSGTTAPTAAQVATALVAAINNDPNAAVTAAVTSTDRVTCTLDNVNDGDFNLINYNSGGVYATSTAYVAPSGTETIVNSLAPGKAAAGGEYTTWKITFDQKKRHAAVSGNKVFVEVDVYIFAEENASNFAAFETELDDILAGTHTPVADYL